MRQGLVKTVHTLPTCSWGSLFCVYIAAAVTHTYKQVAQNNPDAPIEVGVEIQSDPKDFIEQGHSSDP